jgi:hypothetical protein
MSHGEDGSTVGCPWGIENHAHRHSEWARPFWWTKYWNPIKVSLLALDFLGLTLGWKNECLFWRCW